MGRYSGVHHDGWNRKDHLGENLEESLHHLLVGLARSEWMHHRDDCVQTLKWERMVGQGMWRSGHEDGHCERRRRCREHVLRHCVVTRQSPGDLTKCWECCCDEEARVRVRVVSDLAN